ncbi:hypothetical protein E2562_024377 [Oryza meyeriana var. granulata]|uniref:Pentacotripeptide-repeat region of PRORP domain-containing protein n=1 Tax=Oryza meyeriana var. granulata TaxID=110450 RepID=A0A6G1C8K5_9ORYZ|nr:hypothetical protein E2562_024377 [Oryza meyeriana var. granulata]
MGCQGAARQRRLPLAEQPIFFMPNICTYTALVNAFAREGQCEKAGEVFEEMQQAGHEAEKQHSNN